MPKFAYTLETLNREIEALINQVRTLEMYILEIDRAESKIIELNAKINELQYAYEVISKLEDRGE